LKRHNLLLLGARFDFTLDEDLKGAAACDDVKKDLVDKIEVVQKNEIKKVYKISRERIGKEVHYNYSLFCYG